jgi:hypothetical protein
MPKYYKEQRSKRRSRVRGAEKQKQGKASKTTGQNNGTLEYVREPPLDYFDPNGHVT